ncbi:MAG: aminotransferase class V-fold PLP-dependent enzyme [Candidatus Cloacimonetes bacterium]|nr:aminotransferase class V-fold PLP-dependent enzyme [Candidatus Cloacimonadota bacterium]
MIPVSFGSDNHSGVHPIVLDALNRANNDFCVAYGEEEFSHGIENRIATFFGGNCRVWFTMTGTGANVLSIQYLMHSYHCVICAHTAHINVHECGAVQKFTQARLLPITTEDGKLSPELIAPHLEGKGDVHMSQYRIISISQATETGLVYTVAELRTLADFAHANDMLLHVDGARLANALVACNTEPSVMFRDAGVDIVSFGGTKNGLMFGEAIISYLPDREDDLIFYRKQAAQLYSKMRYIAAQYDAYLTDDLWRQNAIQANRMTALLADELEKLPGVIITQPVEANALFAIMPRHKIAPLMDKYHFYMWDDCRNEVRLMCSFNTEPEHIDQFIRDYLSIPDPE